MKTVLKLLAEDLWSSYFEHPFVFFFFFIFLCGKFSRKPSIYKILLQKIECEHFSNNNKNALGVCLTNSVWVRPSSIWLVQFLKFRVHTFINFVRKEKITVKKMQLFGRCVSFLPFKFERFAFSFFQKIFVWRFGIYNPELH